jgi:hypothetical protein
LAGQPGNGGIERRRRGSAALELELRPPIRRRLENDLDGVALGRGAALQREQQGQGDLPFPQVGVGLLAEHPLLGGVVEGVVAQLERQPHLPTEFGQATTLGARDTSENRPRLGGRREQGRALAIDHTVVMGLGHRGIEAPLELQQLPLRHQSDGVREDPHDLEIPVLDDHSRGPRQAEITDQDGAAVAPYRVGRGPTPAHLSQVDDVVVEQAGGVEQLHGRSHLDPARARVAAQLRGEKEQRGAKPLAPRREDVLPDRADQLLRRDHLIAERTLDEFQALGDAIERSAQGRGGG